MVDLTKQPKIDIFQSTLDFYALLSMRNRLEDCKYRSGYYDYADRLLQDYARNFARHIRDYLFIASLGEACHGSDRCNSHELDLWEKSPFSSYPSSRHRVYNEAQHYEVENGTDKLSEVFFGKWSTSGFGGKSWGKCISLNKRYGEISNIMFVDMAINLHHNGGNVFNKPLIFFNYEYLMAFLDHRRTYEFEDNFFRYANKVADLRFLPPILDVLKYYKSISFFKCNVNAGSYEDRRTAYEIQPYCEFGNRRMKVTVRPLYKDKLSKFDPLDGIVVAVPAEIDGEINPAVIYANDGNPCKEIHHNCEVLEDIRRPFQKKYHGMLHENNGKTYELHCDCDHDWENDSEENHLLTNYCCEKCDYMFWILLDKPIKPKEYKKLVKKLFVKTFLKGYVKVPSNEIHPASGTVVTINGMKYHAYCNCNNDNGWKGDGSSVMIPQYSSSSCPKCAMYLWYYPAKPLDNELAVSGAKKVTKSLIDSIVEDIEDDECLGADNDEFSKFDEFEFSKFADEKELEEYVEEQISKNFDWEECDCGMCKEAVKYYQWKGDK